MKITTTFNLARPERDPEHKIKEHRAEIWDSMGVMATYFQEFAGAEMESRLIMVATEAIIAWMEHKHGYNVINQYLEVYDPLSVLNGVAVKGIDYEIKNDYLWCRYQDLEVGDNVIACGGKRFIQPCDHMLGHHSQYYNVVLKGGRKYDLWLACPEDVARKTNIGKRWHWGIA